VCAKLSAACAGVASGPTKWVFVMVLCTRLYTQPATRQLFRRQDGQTMAEYAVILSVISVLVVGALLLLGGNINTVIRRIADAIS
jgi:Flp pilus assembly pilin Flp